MSNQEIKRKRSSPVKSNKDHYLTPAQRADWDKLYDECERFCNLDALRWFREPPYQLVYLERLRQAEQDHKSAADAAGQKTEDTDKKDERRV